jgi:hypothetical protein
MRSRSDANMSMLELPDELHRRLVVEAAERHMTPTEWIEAKLPAGNGRKPSQTEVAEATARLDQLIVSLGHPTGAANKSIDTDLAAEYGGDHWQHGRRPTDG